MKMFNEPYVDFSDETFDGIDFKTISDSAKNAFTSESVLATLLDFEKVLDESDMYAFKNWIQGELVRGPDVKKYNITCVFMYPHKVMPDPRGGKRLLQLGATVKYKLSHVKVPVKVSSPDSQRAETFLKKAKVWLVAITIPIDLLEEVKLGTIDVLGQEVDLQTVDDVVKERNTTNEKIEDVPSQEDEQPEDDEFGDLGL